MMCPDKRHLKFFKISFHCFFDSLLGMKSHNKGKGTKYQLPCPYFDDQI